MNTIPFHSDIDLLGNQLLNAVMHRAETISPPPTGGTVSGGMLWYDTTLNMGKYYSGDLSAFVPFVHFMPLSTLGATPASDDYFLVFDASVSTYKKVVYSNLVTGSGTDELLATANGEKAGYLGTDGTNGVLRMMNNGGFGMGHVTGGGSTVGYAYLYLMPSNFAVGTSSPGLQQTDYFLFTEGSAFYRTTISDLRTKLQISLGTEFEKMATITSHVLELDSQTAGKALMSPAGASGAPTFRAIVTTDLPIIPVTHGGLGANLTSTLAQGSIVFATNDTIYQALAIGSANTILSSTGTVPAWSTLTSLLPSNIQYGASFVINNTTDWAGTGPYTVTITNTGGAKNHALGTGDNFDAVIQKGSAAPYEMAMANWTVDNGTIVITSNAKFSGRILIRRF